MKHLVEYINEEETIYQRIDRRYCEAYQAAFKHLANKENDTVLKLTDDEKEQIGKLFPDITKDSKSKTITIIEKPFPHITIELSKTVDKMPHKIRIIKFSQNNKKEYYGLASENDIFKCSDDKDNLFFDRKMYNIPDKFTVKNVYKDVDFNIKYMDFFNTIDELYQQILNKAKEQLSNLNNPVIYYIKGMWKVDKEWEALLKKYNIDPDDDVIVQRIDGRTWDDKVIEEKSWGKINPELFLNFDKSNNGARYTSYKYRFKDKKYNDCFKEFYDGLSHSTKWDLFYGNGLVD